MYLAGSLVDGMVGWAPISGDQPMSFTIYSYNGEVTVGIACDTALVPDHEMIVDGFSRGVRPTRRGHPERGSDAGHLGERGEFPARSPERSRKVDRSDGARRPMARIRSSKSPPR